MDNPLELLNIKQLLKLKYNFFIPAYQRGYRWRSEQVKMLIEDIQLYIDEENKTSQQNKCPFYCLQAIVVKENQGRLEVIDGQQRLTTLAIIANYKGENPPILGTVKKYTETEIQALLRARNYIQNSKIKINFKKIVLAVVVLGKDQR